MFQLSVCADTVFLDLPIAERIDAIRSAGFSVELWTWKDRDLEALVQEGQFEITSLPGATRGSIVHPDGVEEFMNSARETLQAAQQLGCRNFGLVTGSIGPDGKSAHLIAEHPATLWITAYRSLCQLAEWAEKYQVTYNLEALNVKVDHGGYPLTLVEDVVRLIEQVGSPRIRALLDVYHLQIQEGNVTQVMRDYWDYVGYVHVADVPGRHEPGTGEINYSQVVATLRELGYQGIVGMEAFPEGDDHKALERFRTIFS